MSRALSHIYVSQSSFMMAARISRLSVSTPLTASRASIRTREMAWAMVSASSFTSGDSTARMSSRLPTNVPLRLSGPSGSSERIRLASSPTAATDRRYVPSAPVIAAPPS